MLKTRVMMRVGKMIFLRLRIIAVGLWGMRSTSISSSQNTPSTHITIMNCGPKVSGKLLFVITAKFVSCMPRLPPSKP